MSIAIGPVSLDVVDAGSTVQLTAVGTYRDGTIRDITSTVGWGSSDPDVAVVAQTGLLSANVPGTATISAHADGARASTSVRVAGIAALGVSLVDAPTGYVDNPVVALDGRGHLLLAYGINDLTVSPAVRSLVTRASDASWPPMWIDENASIADPWQTTAPDVQLASNGAGVAGMVYRRTVDGLNGDLYSFGLAYFDGASWKWKLARRGRIDLQMGWRDGARTPVVAVDPSGAVFVAYQGATATYALDELSVARFDPDGTATVTTWPEYVGRVFIAASASGQVMVLNTLTGSRLFDGASWRPVEPFPQNIVGDARLTLDDAGNATLFAFDAQVLRFRRNGSGWSAGQQLQGATSANGSSVATNAAGRSLVAYVSFGIGGSGDQLVARILDGATVGPERVLDDGGAGTFAASLRNPSVLVDGDGRFVVLWERGWTTRATWFDGTWHTTADLGPAGVFFPAVAMRPDGLFVIVDDFGAYNSLYSATFALRP